MAGYVSLPCSLKQIFEPSSAAWLMNNARGLIISAHQRRFADRLLGSRSLCVNFNNSMSVTTHSQNRDKLPNV